ncbi:MAG: hypothetical protein KGH79_02350 [Patescibacteria group bacterium]|nr:hypothetical protein [Patescibacteria group bacterium]
MGKKILYIVLGALLIFGLLFVLWSWFSGSSNQPQNTGAFGTASSTQGTIGTGGQNNTNGQTPLGSSTSNSTVPLGSGSGAGGGTNGGSTVNAGTGAQLSTGGLSIQSTTGVGAATPSVPGVDWLGTPFNAAGINSVSGGAGGFVPTITTTVGSKGSNLTLAEALAAAGIAGTLTCGAQAFMSGTGVFAGAGAGAASAAVGVPVGGPTLAFIAANQSTQTGIQGAGAQRGFLGCIVNVIAKATAQQITVSVVNWINSGFNGQPAFVNNFQQFFTNVADLAAGQFIQGSGLAFLCSPFQLQIKIAIAKAYANRGAQSCTLSRVINDINGFMNGNFAQGGWQGFVSFTTVPTNNPYGAFAYAQAGLATAQSTALQNASNNVTPGGFLALQALNCNGQTTINPLAGQNPQAALAGNVVPAGCKPTITTPGNVIASTLNGTILTQQTQLSLANDLDQIITALTTQLATRVLQNGLTSLSQTTTQTPADIAAESQATSLLTDMQSKTAFEQQLGSIDQGSISDIEQAQSQLNSLANCWQSAASSTAATPAQQAQASQNAASAQTTLSSLNAQIDNYNNDITQINSQIAILNQFESNLSTAASDADVANVTKSYNAAVAADGFATQADVTTAQQNRTTLQAQMASLNSSTQTGLAQCQTYPH